MGLRGPKKKENMIRKWWLIHRITVAQINDIVAECKSQVPLLENTMNESLVISALVARAAKEIESDLFDAAEFIRCFDPGDEEEEAEVAAETSAG